MKDGTKKRRPKPHKPHKPPRLGVSNRGVTVILYPVVGPTTRPRLSRSNGDMIRWFNLDTVDHTLTFNIWVFREPEAPILVPAGQSSGWYTMAPTGITGAFSYAIDPAFAAQGPPDPPEIVGDV